MTNMLEVNNIVKEYTIGTEKVRALDGVSFNVKEGEIVGLIGRSGGGKSTLLNIIRGFEEFDEGRVYQFVRFFTDWWGHLIMRFYQLQEHESRRCEKLVCPDLRNGNHSRLLRRFK